MRRSGAAALATVAILAVAPPSRAHEFWVEPDDFVPKAGEPIAVRLFVGDIGGAGEREELPRSAEHLLRFEAVGGAGSVPVVGRIGSVPAGVLRANEPGPWVLAYRSRHTYLELPAEKFESYLQTEGLSAAIEERVRRGETLSPGRESYARYAKSLLAVGGPSPGARALYETELGLPIEFVAESDPGVWRAGDPFVVRLLYDGRPLADQPVKLIPLAEGGLVLAARTDAEGRVRLQPPQGGRWLVASVYLRRAPAGVRGDWESFWASLTVDLGSRPGSRRPG